MTDLTALVNLHFQFTFFCHTRLAAFCYCPSIHAKAYNARSCFLLASCRFIRCLSDLTRSTIYHVTPTLAIYHASHFGVTKAMAPNTALKRARSPSGGRRRQPLLPAILQQIQGARNESDSATLNSIDNSVSMSSSIDLSDLSDALDSPFSSDQRKELAKARGVRFNKRVSIVEIPAPEQTQNRRVSFSDEVIDIDTAEPTHLSPTPSPPKKRVRFGCLKTSVRKHLSHTSIYKMKNFETISPFMTPKKRVRFGCMKSEAPVTTQSNADVTELLAEEAATFKREKRRDSFWDVESETSEQTSYSEDIEMG